MQLRFHTFIGDIDHTEGWIDTTATWAKSADVGTSLAACQGLTNSFTDAVRGIQAQEVFFLCLL